MNSFLAKVLMVPFIIVMVEAIGMIIRSANSVMLYSMIFGVMFWAGVTYLLINGGEK